MSSKERSTQLLPQFFRRPFPRVRAVALHLMYMLDESTLRSSRCVLIPVLFAFGVGPAEAIIEPQVNASVDGLLLPRPNLLLSFFRLSYFILSLYILYSLILPHYWVWVWVAISSDKLRPGLSRQSPTPRVRTHSGERYKLARPRLARGASPGL